MDSSKEKKVIDHLKYSCQCSWSNCAITNDKLTLLRAYCKGFSDTCNTYDITIEQLCSILENHIKCKYKV